MTLRKIVSIDVVAAMFDITADELTELLYFPSQPADYILPAVAPLLKTLPEPIGAGGDLVWFEDELIQWQHQLAKAREIARRKRDRQRHERDREQVGMEAEMTAAL